MPWFKSEYANERKSNGTLKGHGGKLLSASYKAQLGQLVDEATRQELKLPQGSTWADAIAQQLTLRAIGRVSKEQICFTAITELRETTEGKTAERIVTQGNDELAALARAIAGDPEPEPSTSTVLEPEG